MLHRAAAVLALCGGWETTRDLKNVPPFPLLLHISETTLFFLEETDRLREKTISQMLPNSTDFVISRQLGAIINTSCYVKLCLLGISAPAWTFLRERHASPTAHVAARPPNRVLLAPFPADVFNAVVLQNKSGSKNTEIKTEGSRGR